MKWFCLAMQRKLHALGCTEMRRRAPASNRMKPGWSVRPAEPHATKFGEIRTLSGKGRAGALCEFAKKLADSSIFTTGLQDWLEEKLGKTTDSSSLFKSPFDIDELKQLDYALEGVLFQQLLRMPSPDAAATAEQSSSSSSSSSAQPDMYLAVEDFLHASVGGLWEAFWDAENAMPFFVTGPRGSEPKAHPMERASSRTTATTVPGVALIANSGTGDYVLWDQIAQFVEVKSEVAVGLEAGGVATRIVLTSEGLGCALFHGLLMLLARASSDGKTSFRRQMDTAYVLLIDSRYGGVMKLRGDISKLEMNLDSVYASAVEWVRKHADIFLSNVGLVWNKLGNPIWGDEGTLQLLMATYCSIEQFRGAPRRSIAEVAAEHYSRVQRRKAERRILEVQETGSDSRYHRSQHRIRQEIVEVEKGICDSGNENEPMKLEPGTVLWLEDAHWQRGFQIHEDIGGQRRSVYGATSLDDIAKPLAVYVGAHPSQLEPSWEDMSMWYEVQRQTRILNRMKDREIASNYIPQIVASGRLMHPGQCTRKSPEGCCDHPWCGTPVLVTSPVGESLNVVVDREGFFSSTDALRCCHDCLAALRSSSSAIIQHGDISPEHVIRVKGADGDFYYVLVEWGRAVVEDRDKPAVTPFSSTSAIQAGKLCPASDAESLIYVLYFACGGKTPEFDTLEAALQWRERVWSRRAIQQQLGQVSAVLKAFADYVDILCGTPYAVDYDIWLRRLGRALHHDDRGKKFEHMSTSATIECIAESSGNSGANMSRS